MAQLASAPALGAGGPVFESQYPDDWKSGTYRNVGAFLFCISRSFVAISASFNSYLTLFKTLESSSIGEYKGTLKCGGFEKWCRGDSLAVLWTGKERKTEEDMPPYVN